MEKPNIRDEIRAQTLQQIVDGMFRDVTNLPERRSTLENGGFTDPFEVDAITEIYQKKCEKGIKPIAEALQRKIGAKGLEN